MEISRKDLELWRDFCLWLEGQPYNAAYRIPSPYGRLTLTTKHITKSQYPEHYPRAKKYEQQRKALQLIYWASGYGWRLHKNYRETLAKHGIEVLA